MKKISYMLAAAFFYNIIKALILGSVEHFIIAMIFCFLSYACWINADCRKIETKDFIEMREYSKRSKTERSKTEHGEKT